MFFTKNSVYGYVSSGYGNRDIDDVKADIRTYYDDWREYLNGIMIDEVSPEEDYNDEVFAYIKSLAFNSIANGLTSGENIDKFVTFNGIVSDWDVFNVPSEQLDDVTSTKWCALILDQPSKGELTSILDESIRRNYGFSLYF